MGVQCAEQREAVRRMKAIVCVDKNWAIGADGKTLVSIPADLRWFRDKTMGHVVVMGRKTWNSLPNGRALDGRINIVLSRQKDFQAKGATVVHSRDELLEELKKYDLDDIFIIGGSQIYTLMVPYCDTLYVTKVNYAYQADTWFTNLDLVPEWKLVEESEEQTCFNIEYTFRTYERKYHTARPV